MNYNKNPSINNFTDLYDQLNNKKLPKINKIVELEKIYESDKIVESNNLFISNDNNINKISSVELDIIEINLPKNPYLSSITSKYIFNLDKILSFNIYFLTTDITIINKNQFILDQLQNNKLKLSNWNEEYKKYIIQAICSYTDLINKKINIVSNYEKSNFVFILYNGNKNLGFSNTPHNLHILNTYNDGKISIFINKNYIKSEDGIKPGSLQYLTLLHEIGHAFGLAHPHDNNFGSTIMPGIPFNNNILLNDCLIPQPWFGIGFNNINTVFTTIMGYNNYNYYLPDEDKSNTIEYGYPESLMPLDYAALFYLYKIKSFSNEYILKYGVSTISGLTKSKCIIGNNIDITFDNTCKDLLYYIDDFDNFSPNNSYPLMIKLNRVANKYSSIYPIAQNSSIYTINFNNTQQSFIKINHVFTNKIINCTAPEIYVYLEIKPINIKNLVNLVVITFESNITITINYSNNKTKVNIIY